VTRQRPRNDGNGRRRTPEADAVDRRSALRLGALVAAERLVCDRMEPIIDERRVDVRSPQSLQLALATDGPGPPITAVHATASEDLPSTVSDQRCHIRGHQPGNPDDTA